MVCTGSQVEGGVAESVGLVGIRAVAEENLHNIREALQHQTYSIILH